MMHHAAAGLDEQQQQHQQQGVGGGWASLQFRPPMNIAPPRPPWYAARERSKLRTECVRKPDFSVGEGEH